MALYSRSYQQILFQDIDDEYEKEFVDMTLNKVPLIELLKVREKLVGEIKNSLKETDKEFLLSFVANEADWTKVRDGKIKNYPSVKWKMMNQEKMAEKKKKEYIDSVRQCFEK